jgi:hypothetical protein
MFFGNGIIENSLNELIVDPQRNARVVRDDPVLKGGVPH